MRILGIETSCDETAVCLLEAEGDFGADFSYKILGNALASQAAMHAEYGGVFPNLAKREHARNLVPMLELALREAAELKSGTTIYDSEIENMLEREKELLPILKSFFESHARPNVDAITVTVGPGLEPALWVGVNFAHALSITWDIPVVAVNHMEGHIVISMIDLRGQSSGKLAEFEFPALALLISGGHTELILMKEFGSYKYIGRTRDDAAGEAFDKVARMLGLPYPGGPHISRLAEEARSTKQESRIKLPRPMLHEKNYDFSFAGLKTAVLRLVQAEKTLSEDFKKRVACEFEDAVTDVLVEKTLRASDDYGVKTIIVGGGVSANSHIKATLRKQAEEVGTKLLISPLEFATDNAVMIALAGYFHALKKEFADAKELNAQGGLMLGK